VTALGAGDRGKAQQMVADGSLLGAADGYGWSSPKGRWRLAPGMTANSTELLIFRGAQEAYRVHFAPHGDAWVITAFEPSSRSLE
jgi:hypothetical protein